MKKIKFLAMAALLAVSTGAFAQFTNTKSSGGTAVSTEGWNSVYVQYNPSKIEKESFNGVSLGYAKSISISQQLPLFVEVGVAGQYSFYSKKGVKFNMISAKVPVNLTYSWQVTDNITIDPYVGITLRGNIYGRGKNFGGGVAFTLLDRDDFDDYDDYYDYLESLMDKLGFETYTELYEYVDKLEDGGVVSGKSVDLFNKNKMGGDPFKRFQIGWQIGANVKFNNKFYLGASYGTDFNKIQKNAKVKTASITAGIIF